MVQTVPVGVFAVLQARAAATVIGGGAPPDLPGAVAPGARGVRRPLPAAAVPGRAPVLGGAGRTSRVGGSGVERRLSGLLRLVVVREVPEVRCLEGVPGWGPGRRPGAGGAWSGAENSSVVSMGRSASRGGNVVWGRR
ncbi:hypothetical protein LUW77_14360 [Streptomyces radiopugnans]|nr:hypothetical protein LUW77_14360 [Streptomyces radiopugnans]